MLPGEHRLLRHGQPQATKEISGRGSCRPRKAGNSTMIWRVIPDNPACRTKSRPGVGKVKGSTPQEQLSHVHDIRREEMICIDYFLGTQDFAYERGRDEAAARGLAAVGKLTKIVEVEAQQQVWVWWKTDTTLRRSRPQEKCKSERRKRN